MAELEKVGPLTEAERNQLVEDMRRTDPSLWPLVLEAFQTARAYREQRLARGAPPPAPVAPPSVVSPPVAPPSQPPAPTPVESLLTGAARIQPETTPPGVSSMSVVRASGETTDAPPSSAPPVPPQSPAPSAIATNAAMALTTSAALPQEMPTPTPIDQPPKPIDPLAETIRNWEAAPAGPLGSPEEIRRQETLRLLYLIAGRREDALRPLEGATTAEQEYWSSQIFALASYLDNESISDPARRAAETRLHLQQASSALSQSASLLPRNIAFCTEVSSFGVFTRVESTDFYPGQEVLLYCELENFHSEPTPKGFHTALRSSYKIFDNRGQQVTEHEFPLTEEYCENRRRDFFIRYFLTIPKRIYPGRHTLKLTIEDTLGQKINQISIDFNVKDTAAAQ